MVSGGPFPYKGHLLHDSVGRDDLYTDPVSAAYGRSLWREKKTPEYRKNKNRHVLECLESAVDQGFRDSRIWYFAG